MSGAVSAWLGLARSAGQALVELVGAELSTLSSDLKLSGRRVLGAVVLFLLALFAVFWGLGVLTLTAVEYLALSFPRWQAGLLVVGGLALVAAILALVGWWRVRTTEAPAATLRRRLNDHQAWWEERIDGSEGGSTGRRDGAE